MQRMTQVDAQINGQGARRLTVSEMLVGRKGLFKGGYCLSEGLTLDGCCACLTAVGHGFLPHLAPHGMMG